MTSSFTMMRTRSFSRSSCEVQGSATNWRVTTVGTDDAQEAEDGTIIISEDEEGDEVVVAVVPPPPPPPPREEGRGEITLGSAR